MSEGTRDSRKVQYIAYSKATPAKLEGFTEWVKWKEAQESQASQRIQWNISHLKQQTTHTATLFYQNLWAGSWTKSKETNTGNILRNNFSFPSLQNPFLSQKFINLDCPPSTLFKIKLMHKLSMISSVLCVKFCPKSNTIRKGRQYTGWPVQSVNNLAATADGKIDSFGIRVEVY